MSKIRGLAVPSGLKNHRLLFCAFFMQFYTEKKVTVILKQFEN